MQCLASSTCLPSTSMSTAAVTRQSVLAPAPVLAGPARRFHCVRPRGARLEAAAPAIGRRVLRAAPRLAVSCGPAFSHPNEERSSSGAAPSPYSGPLLSSYSAPSTSMARGGLGSSNGATLQRSKLDLKQEVRTSAPKLDDGMGGGGIGKGLFNGGGGDGGDGDDDDYFNEFGDGDEGGDGDGFFRRVLGELYDARSISAVLEEWFRTMADLPVMIRMAAQMGLFSSAALVRFMAMDVRPGVTRFVTRALPTSVSREVVGRLMADPAFMQKMLVEQAITISASLAYEARIRGDAFWSELDLVVSNTLCLAAANAALVYLVAPTRAAPAPQRFEWQNAVSKLPNNAFERSTPLRQYSQGARAASLLVKAAELSGVGMLAGGAQAALGRALCALRQRADPAWRPSVVPANVRQSALGLAATYGIFGHLRYQVVAGVDRYLFDHANFIWSYLIASGTFRALSTGVGEPTRVYLQGLPSQAAPGAAAALAKRRAAALARARAAAAAAQQPRKRSGTAAGAKRRRAAGFEVGIGEPAAAPVMA